MPEQLLGSPSQRQIIFAVVILVVFIGMAWGLRVYFVSAIKKLAKSTRTELDDIILATLEKPVIAIIILGGLYLAAVSLPLHATLYFYVSKGLIALLTILAIYAVLALIDVLVRWSERTVMAKTESGLTRRLLWLSRVIIWIIGAVGAVVVVMNIMEVQPLPISDWLGEHGWRIAFIVVLSMVAIVIIANVVPKVIEKATVKFTGEPEEEVEKRANTLSRVLVNVGQVVTLLIAAFMVLSELEIDITPILAGVGVAGIAIGFGAQSLIKDLLGGIFIIMENQYHVGDVVRIADIGGLVEDINLRRTILRDLDGIVHVVPNGEIRVASNYTKQWSRVNINVSVAYKENLDHVISVINRVGEELSKEPEWAPLILKAPQVLRVDNLGESGVEIKILGDTKPIKQWDVMGELLKRLKNTFDKEGIEIGLPSSKVYFGNLSPDPGRNQTIKKQ